MSSDRTAAIIIGRCDRRLTESQLYQAVEDGLLLPMLIAEIEPTAIDVGQLHNPMRSDYQKVENHSLCIAAARKLGYCVRLFGRVCGSDVYLAAMCMT